MKPLDLEEIKMEMHKLRFSDKWLDSKGFEQAREKVFNLIVKQIRGACEFYLKYKNKPGLLIKDYPEYEKEVLNKIDVNENIHVVNLAFNGFMINKFMDYKEIKKWFDELSEYQRWLFKLAFKSVLESE